MTLGSTAPLMVLGHDWTSPVEIDRRVPVVVIGPMRDGGEQRQALSSASVDTITYRLVAPDWYDAQVARIMAQVADDSLVRMPRWEDQARVTTAVSAGDLTIPCDPSDKVTFVAGVEVLLWRDAQTYEVGTIDTVGASSIDVVDPLTDAWGAGTIVVPITPCRVVLPLDLTNWVPVTAGVQQFTVTTDLRDIAGVGTGGSSTTTTATALSVSAITVGAGGRTAIYATVTDASGLVIPATGLVWSTNDAVNAPVTNTSDPAIAMVGNPNSLDDNSSFTITATLGALSDSATAFLEA